MKQFTNLYPVTKSLKFELIPIGDTLANIKTKGFLEEDEKRAENYKKVIEILDRYHKYFIDDCLCGVRLKGLKEFYSVYKSAKDAGLSASPKSRGFGEDLKEIQNKLRKEISDAFTAHPKFENLFRKEIIKEDLKEWIEDSNKKSKNIENAEKLLLTEFERFTTYFSHYHISRKNLYSSNDKTTAIAYRIIHDNLPRFVDNLKVFDAVKGCVDFTPILKDMRGIIKIDSLEEVFTLNFFNNILTQNGIDAYNGLISGMVKKEGDTKIKGLNEYINIYNQKDNKKDNKVPKFKPLYKQILSDREGVSWMLDHYSNDRELLKSINEFYKSELENAVIDGDRVNVLKSIETLIKSLPKWKNVGKIYIKGSQLLGLSKLLFDDARVFGWTLNYYYDNYENPKWRTDYAKGNESKRTKLEIQKSKFTKPAYISLATLQTALDKYAETLDDNSNVSQKHTETIIIDHFAKHKTMSADIMNSYKKLKEFLNSNPNTKLIKDKERVRQIKTFLDSIMQLLHFVKPLAIGKNANIDIDDLFYGEFSPLYDKLTKTTSIYIRVQSYLTKKPYSLEKFKLNFENPTLLSGWDVNKERDYCGIILIKDDLYYFGVLDRKHNKVFENMPVSESKRVYKKMNYKLIPGPNKILPKVFLSAKGLDKYDVPDKIYENYNKGTHKKGNNFKLADCHKLIDFFKSSIQKHEDWKQFNFKFSNTKDYKDISGFYSEVENQAYKITFNDIDEDYINKLVENGHLYLFQIYNKDFSTASKGKPNLHTLYWRGLFSEENLNDVIYKLNGRGALFYRRKSIEDDSVVVHRAKDKIQNKNPLSTKRTSVYNYDIVKDKRYTEDKFQFHIPITMNFKSIGFDYINPRVNDYLRNNKDVKIIGLSRGQQHLIYLTLIDQKGQILQQESLNIVQSEKHKIKTNYYDLLEQKEKERGDAIKEWSNPKGIEKLKEGYISQVVHKVAKMMIEHNAIVVLEDLNFGNFQEKPKVENQVYQKLQMMLTDKLNYLVIKDRKPNELGGLYNALQLTNRFESFLKVGKQSGFLFVMPAPLTAHIDPTTGFVNYLNPKYESVKQSKSYFLKFKNISYDGVKKCFEFAFDYQDFTVKTDDTQTKWSVFTFGDRLETLMGVSKLVNINDKFIELFEEYKIDFIKNKNIKSAILEQKDKGFFERLMYLLQLTLQMQNTKIGTGVDYFISPVENKSGGFYDSRKKRKGLPHNVNANTAYHFAMKGLWILKKGLFNTNEKGTPNLALTNKEWLQFVQNK